MKFVALVTVLTAAVFGGSWQRTPMTGAANGTGVSGLLVDLHDTAVVAPIVSHCQPWGCGANGTQLTGLLVDLN